jgi:hypothetical protein
MSKTATYVGVPQEGWQGDARIYRVDPPMSYYPTWEGPASLADHVVVSATTVMYTGPETYIFPADAEGKVLDWGELDGSFRGRLDHEEALRGAGYEVIA